MRRFDIVPAESALPDDAPAPAPASPDRVYRRPYRGITLAMVVFGLSWGLANFGLLTWLPSYVAKSGISAHAVTAILAKAALFSIPGALVVAWLYGRWGSKATMIATASLMAVTLGVFALFGSQLPRHDIAFTVVVVALLVALWASVAVLAPYSAEVYPTDIRAMGSGVAAGATKLGGVFALALAVAALAPPALAGSALLAAIPAGLGVLLLVAFGIETRGRSLEEISTSVLTQSPDAAVASPPA